jgi:hypothetical protein
VLSTRFKHIVQELEIDGGQGMEVNGRQEVEIDSEQDVEQDVDGGQEVNRRQRRVGDEYAMGGIRLQTLLPPPELPAVFRASCLLPPEPLTSSRASDLLQRAFDRLQSLLTTASRACYRLQSSLPPPELPAVSCCAASGTFDLLQSL